MMERPSFSSSLARLKTASAPSPVSCETRVAIFGMAAKSYHLVGIPWCRDLGSARALRPPRYKGFRVRLERQPQRELNQPRRPGGREDLPERTVRPNRFHIGDRGIRKIGVVPDVEEVCGELGAEPLRQVEILLQ